jgi:hypothetical protein
MGISMLKAMLAYALAVLALTSCAVFAADYAPDPVRTSSYS